MNEENKQEQKGFDGLGIAEKLLTVIKKAGLEAPTPIQHESIPVAIQGKDLVGVAQTGTGKTLAFSIPMLQRLALYKGRGLVLLPTRELALQVDEALRKYGMALGLRTAVLIGGENIGRQIEMLRRHPHVIVATPGRLNDHLDRRSVKLDDVKILILDEADLMLDMGFMPQIERVLKHVPKERQTMLFSATMPAEIIKLANAYMIAPIRIEVAPSGTMAEKVEQEIFIVEKQKKLAQLEKLLKEYAGQVLIFCRTKHGVKNLTDKISLMGYSVAEIHSNRTQIQRRKALDGFRAGRFRVLIATDIAARGIDVSGIELVVNYDLPEDASDYVHRIGRTGRAGKSGKAISFADPMQAKEIREIERLVKKTLPLRELSPLYKSAPAKRSFGRRGGGFARSFSRQFSAPAKFSGSKPLPFAAKREPAVDFKNKKPFVSRSNFLQSNNRPARYKSKEFFKRPFGKSENNFSRSADPLDSYLSERPKLPAPRFSSHSSRYEERPKRSERPFADRSVRPERKFSTDRERFRASLRQSERPAFKRKNFSASRPKFR